MNEIIYYKSPIGWLRIKNDGKAIAEVAFADKEGNADMKAINNQIPTTTILKKCIKQLDEYFAGKRFQFDLVLAQPGTEFQQSVWTGLLEINYGKTLSYLSFSKKLGNAKAIRAVGTANGKNNIAIIVPCHRVIGSNGTLIGYGGELWRKKWLLEHEAKYGNGVQTLF